MDHEISTRTNRHVQDDGAQMRLRSRDGTPRQIILEDAKLAAELQKQENDDARVARQKQKRRRATPSTVRHKKRACRSSPVTTETPRICKKSRLAKPRQQQKPEWPAYDDRPGRSAPPVHVLLENVPPVSEASAEPPLRPLQPSAQCPAAPGRPSIVERDEYDTRRDDYSDDDDDENLEDLIEASFEPASSLS